MSAERRGADGRERAPPSSRAAPHGAGRGRSRALVRSRHRAELGRELLAHRCGGRWRPGAARRADQRRGRDRQDAPGRRAARRARADGARRPRGTALDLGGAPPFGLWIELLAGLARELDAAAAPTPTGRRSSPACAVAAAPARPRARPPADVPPELARARLFEAAVELAEHATATAPLVLLLDDVHVADAPTPRARRLPCAPHRAPAGPARPHPAHGPAPRRRRRARCARPRRRRRGRELELEPLAAPTSSASSARSRRSRPARASASSPPRTATRCWRSRARAPPPGRRRPAAVAAGRGARGDRRRSPTPRAGSPSSPRSPAATSDRTRAGRARDARGRARRHGQRPVPQRRRPLRLPPRAAARGRLRRPRRRPARRRCTRQLGRALAAAAEAAHHLQLAGRDDLAATPAGRGRRARPRASRHWSRRRPSFRRR